MSEDIILNSNYTLVEQLSFRRYFLMNSLKIKFFFRSNDSFHCVQVTIYVRIVFLKVGEIDTLRDRFAADAFIQAKWREPAMDGKLRLVRIHRCWLYRLEKRWQLQQSPE